MLTLSARTWNSYIPHITHNTSHIAHLTLTHSYIPDTAHFSVPLPHAVRSCAFMGDKFISDVPIPMPNASLEDLYFR